MDFLLTPGFVLNLVVVLGLLVFGPRALKVSQLKAELKAKDDVIATREQTNQALSDRLDVLEVDLASMREQAEKDRAKIALLERDVTEWRTRYDEMQHYAAPEALAAVSKQIGSADETWHARWTAVEALMRDLRDALDRPAA